ncbi:hypothetical protein E2320_004581 [Naja naja]|nr:hypothetical protein E2320_004581 [Naja naja]
MDIQASHALLKICLKAATIWIFSMLLAIPEAVFSDLRRFYDKGTNKTFISCTPYPLTNELHPKIQSMASFLIFYIIPLSVISVYYYFIAKNLIQSAYNLPVEGTIQVRKQMESRKRLAKTVLQSFRKQFNHQLSCYKTRLLIRSQSTARSTTRMTSFKSTNQQSMITFSFINGNHNCHEENAQYA